MLFRGGKDTTVQSSFFFPRLDATLAVLLRPLPTSSRRSGAYPRDPRHLLGVWGNACLTFNYVEFAIIKIRHIGMSDFYCLHTTRKPRSVPRFLASRYSRCERVMSAGERLSQFPPCTRRALEEGAYSSKQNSNTFPLMSYKP